MSLSNHPNCLGGGGAEGIFLSTPNTFSSTNQFNGGFGVNGLGSQSLMDTTVPTYFRRTDVNASAAISLGAHLEYITSASTNSEIVFGMLCDYIYQGSASGGGGHGGGFVGRYQDTSASGMAGYGIEGKCIIKGTSDATSALHGIADYIGTSHTGRTRIVYDGFAEIFANDGSTPLAQGAIIIYRGYKGTGGDPTQNYVLLGDLTQQIKTGGKITSADSTDATHSIAIFNDHTDSWIQQAGGGTLRIDPGASSYVTIQQGSGFAHLTAGTLGHPSFPWGKFYSNDFIANGSVATVLTGVGPAGSHTTVQKWWKVNDGTNDLFIPCF